MANDQVVSVVQNNSNVPQVAPTHRQNCLLSRVLNAAVVIFIGGAGDKESYYFNGPFQNMLYAKSVLDPKFEKLARYYEYISLYWGYNEVKGKEEIQKNIINRIPSKQAHIYIIGHSLGGWNGAHLSSILTDLGYVVEMLVTLDPVGKGTLVWIGSNIHRTSPLPKAKYWINILASPAKPDASDTIAELGGRWIIRNGANLNHTADVNHYNAKKMMTIPLAGKKSAADLVCESIRKVAAL